MSEEKNDNLPEADGNENPQTPVDNQETTSENAIGAADAETSEELATENADAEEVSPGVVADTEETAEVSEPENEVETSEDVPEETADEVSDEEVTSQAADSSESEVPAEISSGENNTDAIPEPEAETETDAQAEEPADSAENVAEPEVFGDEIPLSETAEAAAANEAVDAISETNAAESEDSTIREELPMQDYEALSMENLVGEIEKLVSTDKIMSVREHVEQIRAAFLSKYNHFIEEKKEEFNAETHEPGEEFHYNFPLKTKFDQFYNLYRDKKNTHFKSLQSNLQANLENRLAIVEELKSLVNPQENIKDTLKHFNDLRDRWKNAGPIPKDKYNHVWNNYHFHLENFYDYLHLDREARDLDFKHNLEQKQKIVARTEELVNEPDINKAFRELQDLHKIWKEDIGPVSRDHREEIWNRFSALTKQIHDKREVLLESLRGRENENLAKKKDIIAQIELLATEKVGAHASWQAQVEKVEALRNEFFAAGKVPSEVNEETWNAFKTAVRNFNSLKNSFYKDIKKDQNDNLTKKQALVERAKALQESEDFAAATPVMKQIQEEWKQVGHVPRKFSDKIWKEFKDACNHYFERLKANRSEANAEEVEAFDKKKAFLDTMKEFEFTGSHKTDLDAIKVLIETWKGFGKVPFSRRHIDGKFNKILDGLFEKLSLSKKDTEMMRFSNRMGQLSESNDTRKMDNEKIFLMRRIDEVQGEIFQLENNIQFFTNTKNAKKENSIVTEVRKTIEKHREELTTLKEKLKQLRAMDV